MNTAHNKQQNNWAHNAGPHNSLPSTNGFLNIYIIYIYNIYNINNIQ
jgi:hypothetical protein